MRIYNARIVTISDSTKAPDLRLLKPRSIKISSIMYLSFRLPTDEERALYTIPLYLLK